MRNFHKSFSLVSTTHSSRTVSEQFQLCKQYKVYQTSQIQSFSDYTKNKEFDVQLWDYYPIIVVPEQFTTTDHYAKVWKQFEKSTKQYVWKYNSFVEIENKIDDSIILIIVDYFNIDDQLFIPSRQINKFDSQEAGVEFTYQSIQKRFQQNNLNENLTSNIFTNHLKIMSQEKFKAAFKKKSSHTIEQELNKSNQQIVSQDQIYTRSLSSEHQQTPIKQYTIPFIDQLNETLYKGKNQEKFLQLKKQTFSDSNRFILINYEVSQKLIKNLLKKCEIEKLQEPIKMVKQISKEGDLSKKSRTQSSNALVSSKYMQFEKLFQISLNDNHFQLLLIFTYDFHLTMIKLFSKITYALFQNQQNVEKQQKLLHLLLIWLKYRRYEFEEYIEQWLLVKALLKECKETFPKLLDEVLLVEGQLDFKRKKSTQNLAFNNTQVNSNLAQGLDAKEPQNLSQDKFPTRQTHQNEGILKQSNQEQICTQYFVGNTFKFYQLNEIDFVEQCCLVDYELFQQMKIRELFSDKRLKDRQINLDNNCNRKKIASRFNSLTYYFILQIIQEQEERDQLEIINKIIRIGELAFNNNNFFLFQIVFISLNHHIIDQVIQYKSKSSYINQRKLYLMNYYMSYTSNYEQLRKLIKNAQSPFIPCLNLICKDFTFVDYSEEDQIEDNGTTLLNIYKLEQFAMHIEDLLRLQQKPYPFQKDQQLYAYLSVDYLKYMEMYTGINDKIEVSLLKMVQNKKQKSKTTNKK